MRAWSKGKEQTMELERLQKYISRCGYASRRKAEELIVAGKVQVNGRGHRIGD